MVQSILQSNDTEWLVKKLKRTRKKDRKAIIKARIDNLNYLVIQ